MSQPNSKERRKERRAKKVVVKEAVKAITGNAKKPQHLKKENLARSVHKSAAAASPSTRAFFARFSHRDAHKLAWMAMVADPWNAPPVPVPVSITPGASPACPMMFDVNLRGFMITTTNGRGYVGANADAWLPDPTQAIKTQAVPWYSYLGNSSSFGARGYPVHYTQSTYAGTGAGDYRSYPGPAIALTAATPGLFGLQLPNNFINVQLDNSPASGNNFQRYNNVAVSLRCRPVTPATSSLVMSGTLLAVQQTLGDTFATNPAAANAAATIGGIDAFAYVGGFQSLLAAGANPLNQEMASITEWDMAKWPKDADGTHNWLTISAIPNQSCSFGQYAPGNTGSALVGYPQLAFLAGGGVAGQTIEFEARYIYAFYGGTSYQARPEVVRARMPASDVASVMASGAPHLIGPNKSALTGAAAVSQERVDNGGISAGQAAGWIKSGSDLVEQVTGQSVGELIGEGLGLLASILL